MRRSSPVVALAVALSALTIGALGCGGPKLARAPLDLSHLLPATIEADRAASGHGEPKVAKVRIYADAAVRADPHWRDAISDELDYASSFLTPFLGLKLTIESVRDWDRQDATTGATNDAHAALRALAALDPGDPPDGVTWVIGYIAPLDVSSTAMSELGDAAPLGHHVVLHAWAEVPETTRLAAHLPELSTTSRAEVLGAHHRHKQTAALLHFLAVTLGAIAENDPSWLLHAAYAPKQSTLSDRNQALCAITLGEWLGGGTRTTAAAKLLDSIQRTEWGGWVARDQEAVVAVLRNVVDQGKAGKTAADVPPEIYDQYDRVRSLGKKGQGDLALAELEGLISAYPANATLFALRCELLLAAPRPAATAPTGKPGAAPKPGAASPPAPAAFAACARVTDLAAGDPTPHLALAEAWLRAMNPTAARAELALAEAALPNLKASATDGWQRLVAAYQGMGALTWTEAALDHAGAQLPADAATAIRAELAQTRARYGVPAAATFVAAADEGALVAQTRAALELVYASKFAEADRALAAAEKQWKRAPGLAAVRCDLALRQQQLGPAAAACARALAAFPDDSWARYLSGVLALRDPSAAATARGVAHLRRAIAVDPELGQAWRALGKALARVHDQPGLDALRAAYQAKFGSALPD